MIAAAVIVFVPCALSISSSYCYYYCYYCCGASVASEKQDNQDLRRYVEVGTNFGIHHFL